MNIWIIDPYSDIPQMNWRKGRYFLLGEVLSEYGFNVHLFISNFSHKDKTFFTEYDKIEINKKFNVVIVPTSLGYKNHISFSRIRYEQSFAKRIALNEKKITPPSIVILKDPAIFLFKNLSQFIEKSEAKLIIDIIDLWPELFELKLPKKIRWLGKYIFFSFYRRRYQIYNKASALIAVSPDYLELGLSIKKTPYNDVIYWGANVKTIQDALYNPDKGIISELNLPLKGNNIWGIYSGTLGENYDLKTLVCAASKLEKLYPNLIILVAGRGPLEEYIEAVSQKCNNLFYIGSLPTNKLYQLFSYCDFGFSTYSEASTVSMPVKSYDYFAAGLPLVNSLNRNLGLLIKKYNLGFQYTASDCESLVNTIISLMENVELLQEQKQNCLEISKFFDEEEQYKKIITIVKNLL